MMHQMISYGALWWDDHVCSVEKYVPTMNSWSVLRNC